MLDLAPDFLTTGTGAIRAADDSGLNNVATEEWILAGAVIAGAIVVSVLLRKAINVGSRRAGAPPAIAGLFARFAGYLTIIIGFFYAMSTIDVSVGPLLGTLGIGGVALAFALQEILSNMVSGVLLQVRRPFVVGDQVVSGDHEGVVEKINLRVVQLRTFDGEQVYIPNSQVLQNPITNWTATPTRRTTLNVGVAYAEDLGAVQRALLDAVGSVDAVEVDPAPQAFVYEFGESSINFAVRYWHRAPILDMWQARDAVAQAIKNTFDVEGITIAFPQRTLWFGPGQTELAIRDRRQVGAPADAEDD